VTAETFRTLFWVMILTKYVKLALTIDQDKKTHKSLSIFKENTRGNLKSKIDQGYWNSIH